jgi:hypothetical protein
MSLKQSLQKQFVSLKQLLLVSQLLHMQHLQAAQLHTAV